MERVARTRQKSVQTPESADRTREHATLTPKPGQLHLQYGIVNDVEMILNQPLAMVLKW